jgi:hypothetical protein
MGGETHVSYFSLFLFFLSTHRPLRCRYATEGVVMYDVLGMRVPGLQAVWFEKKLCKKEATGAVICTTRQRFVLSICHNSI